MIILKYLSVIVFLYHEIKSANNTYTEADLRHPESPNNVTSIISNNSESLKSWFETIFPNVTTTSEEASSTDLDKLIANKKPKPASDNLKSLGEKNKIFSTSEIKHALSNLQDLLVDYSQSSLVFNNSYINYLRLNKVSQEQYPVTSIYLLSEAQYPRHLQSLSGLELTDELISLLSLFNNFNNRYPDQFKGFQSELFNTTILKSVPTTIKSQLKNNEFSEAYQSILTMAYTTHDFLMDQYLKSLTNNSPIDNLELGFDIDYAPIVDLNNEDSQIDLTLVQAKNKSLNIKDEPNKVQNGSFSQSELLSYTQNKLVPNPSSGNSQQEREFHSLKPHLYKLAMQKIYALSTDNKNTTTTSNYSLINRDSSNNDLLDLSINSDITTDKTLQRAENTNVTSNKPDSRKRKPRDLGNSNLGAGLTLDENGQQTKQFPQQPRQSLQQPQAMQNYQQPEVMQNYQHQQTMQNYQQQQAMQNYQQQQAMQIYQQQFIQYPNQQFNQFPQQSPINQPYYNNAALNPSMMGGNSYVNMNYYNPNPNYYQNFNGFPQGNNYSPQPLNPFQPNIITAPPTQNKKEAPRNPITVKLSELYDVSYDVMKRNQPIIDYLMMAHSILPPRAPRKKNYRADIESGQLLLLKVPSLSYSGNVVGLVHTRIPKSHKLIIQHYNIKEKLYLPITIEKSQIYRIVT